MIKKIHLKNFKCFKNSTFQCQNLNLLTGINSMGKSSLIQSLLVLRQSIYEKNITNSEHYFSFQGDLVDIGSFEDAIFQDFEKEEPFIETNIEFSNSNLKAISKDYYLDSNTSHILFDIKDFDKNILKESLFTNGKFQFIQADRIGSTDMLPTDYRNVVKKDFGKHGQFAMHYFLENCNKEIIIKELAHPDETDLLLEQQMNAWLSEISSNIRIKSTFHPMDKTKIIPQFGYFNEIERKPFKSKNIGFGISYVFSTILALLTAHPNDLIIIENPEAHLHPRGQTKFAELAALAAQNGVQVFIETHSDHIINGVRISVKQHQKDSKWGINENNVAIYYFDKDNQQNSKTTLININNKSKLYTKTESGNLAELPKGFFDEFGNSLSKLI